jgi:hypothetical protein
VLVEGVCDIPICMCCDSTALLLAGQTGAHEMQLMLSQLSVMLFRVRNSIRRIVLSSADLGVLVTKITVYSYV